MHCIQGPTMVHTYMKTDDSITVHRRFNIDYRYTAGGIMHSALHMPYIWL